jgi:hypothetical protein
MADSILLVPAASRLSCAVCGSGQIHCDSVYDGALLHMAECARCDHRWTWRGSEMSLAGLPSVRKAAPQAALREVPNAA